MEASLLQARAQTAYYRGAVIHAYHIDIGPGAEIADDVRIDAERVVIGPGARIDGGVTIAATDVHVGRGAVIEHDCAFQAIGAPMDRLYVGDQAFIGYGQRVLLPVLLIGDYTALHNSCFINGYDVCELGHNCWVGQETILNATARLTCGNNVRIGTRSQLWTHVASGEVLEGCTLMGADPLVLEDNVWIVGGAVVSPNVTVANSTVVMVGSVLTRSTEARHCYAGVPARDITDKITPYREVSMAEKVELMRGFVAEFHEATDRRHVDQVHLVEEFEEASPDDRPALVIATKGRPPDLGTQVSTFSLGTKEYTKRSTDLEVLFIRFNLSYRARFVPIDEPRVTGQLAVTDV